MPAQSAASWDNAETEARIDALLSEMSLEEKVQFATGEMNWNYGFYADGVERLGIPNIQMADGPAGVRINKGDVHDGTATQLPAPIALAATWDPALATQYGEVIGDECRATDHNVSLGPAVDIARVPIGGRTFESFGEDPLLQSRIGVALVRGIQSQGVQACAKHYAINNQEDQRNSIDVVIDERTMRELYLPSFEALIREGEVASMMGSFNRVNGDFACENPELLTQVLREVFEFRGWIMSDYGANHSTVQAANAGLDQEQPNEGFWGGQLVEAVQRGEVAESTIDAKVRNILRPLIGMGQVENPVGIAAFDEEGHHRLAQDVAEAGTVLLRNDGILPLDTAPGGSAPGGAVPGGTEPAGTVRSIALIGPDVDAASAQGGGSSQVRGTRGVSPEEGLRAVLGDDVELTVLHGTDAVTVGALLPGADPIGSGFFRTPGGEPGLHAEYWTNTDLWGAPLVARTDGVIELMHGFHNFPGFNASSASYERLPVELNGQMSARYTGTLTVPVTGEYRFVVTSLGSYSFTLDGRVIANSERGDSARGDSDAETAADSAADAAADAAADSAPVVETGLQAAVRAAAMAAGVIALDVAPAIAEPAAAVSAASAASVDDVIDLTGGDGSATGDADSGVAPVPYGAGGDGNTVAPSIDEVVVRLQAGRAYRLRLEYSANDPSQGFLQGAKLRLGWVPPTGVLAPSVIEAAAAAAAADVAVVVVRTYEAEADDRPNLALPSGQNALIRAVLAANPRTVVVLMAGAPVDVTSWGAEPAALLQAWYPGQAQGDALARVLTGAAEPGGRLPLTLPASLEQTPAAAARTYPGVDGQVHYDEGVFVGYRGFDAHGLEPAYPFGHGLGYTEWAFSNLLVTPGSGATDDVGTDAVGTAAVGADVVGADGFDTAAVGTAAVSGFDTAVVGADVAGTAAARADIAGTVEFTVQNTGARAGSTIAQLYVGELPAPVPTPPQQLAGFAKVTLEAGESQRVSLPIARRSVSYFDVLSHDWATPAGDVAIRVGASSRDIRLTGSLPVA